MTPQSQSSITLRKAILADAPAITELVNRFAARGMMLPKTLLQVFESLREFVVAVDEEGRVLACGALRLMWHDLAEVRSLAVDEGAQGRGLGRQVVERLIEEGREMGLARIFALTYQELFFEKMGFERCEKDIFPQKVWADCRACPKRHCCDEIAMLLVLDASRAARANEEARAQKVVLPPAATPPLLAEAIPVHAPFAVAYQR